MEVWGLNRKPTTRTTSTETKELLQRWRAVSQADIHILVCLPFAHVCVWAAVALLSPLCLPWDLASFSHSALSNAPDLQTAERRAENELLYTAAITPSLPHSVQNLTPVIYLMFIWHAVVYHSLKIKFHNIYNYYFNYFFVMANN